MRLSQTGPSLVGLPDQAGIESNPVSQTRLKLHQCHFSPSERDLDSVPA